MTHQYMEIKIKELEKRIKALEQKPCEDAISKTDLEECKELMTDINGDAVYAVRMSDIRQLPPVNPLEAVEQDKSKNNVLEQLKNLIDEFNMRDLSFDEMSGFECKVLELLEQDYICDTCKTAGKER